MNANTKPFSQQLKSLQVRRNDYANQLAILKSEIANLQCKAAKCKKEIDKIDTQIKGLSQKSDCSLIVSEHALLRYCQRVMGIDLEKITAEIISPQLCGLVKVCGNGKFPIVEKGFAVRIKDSVVVTIEPLKTT